MAENKGENYLEKIPVTKENVRWNADSDGLVTIEIDNKGFFNRLLQLIAKKPKTSFIHLDKLGSFVWQCIDGARDIISIGKLVEEAFGEGASPVYERLVKFFAMLDASDFIEFKKN